MSSTNPYESPADASKSVEIPNRRITKEFTLLEVIVALGIVALIVMLLWPTDQTTARRVQCMNNLKHIAIALWDYHDEHGCFPPAFTTDEEGNRLHSWRTLLLPYADQRDLFEKIDLSKPWDHPANEFARSRIPPWYRCPSSSLPNGFTTYHGLVAHHAFFSPDGVPRSADAFTDGTDSTLAIAEVAQTDAIHWMDPSDDGLPLFLNLKSKPQTAHSSGNAVLMVDGSVYILSVEDMARGTASALTTIDGAEEVDGDEFM